MTTKPRNENQNKINDKKEKQVEKPKHVVAIPIATIGIFVAVTVLLMLIIAGFQQRRNETVVEDTAVEVEAEQNDTSEAMLEEDGEENRESDESDAEKDDSEVDADNENSENETEEDSDESASDQNQEIATTIVRGPNGHSVCIDPGHQLRGDSAQEPNGPGSTTMKARVTGGTHGTTTGVYEYQLNLDVSLKLRDELERRGYTVFMTRETHEVNISNKERAEYATQVGAEVTLRVHANGADSASANGAMMLVPSENNPYVSYLAADSYLLGQAVLNSYCEATGMKNGGVSKNDTMTGINWCTTPVTIIELGFMTNPTDDLNMQNADYQEKMVQGMANGIDAYFGL